MSGPDGRAALAWHLARTAPKPPWPDGPEPPQATGRKQRPRPLWDGAARYLDRPARYGRGWTCSQWVPCPPAPAGATLATAVPVDELITSAVV